MQKELGSCKSALLACCGLGRSKAPCGRKYNAPSGVAQFMCATSKCDKKSGIAIQKSPVFDPSFRSSPSKRRNISGYRAHSFEFSDLCTARHTEVGRRGASAQHALMPVRNRSQNLFSASAAREAQEHAPSSLPLKLSPWIAQLN